MLADLTADQRALADYMSDLSEQGWHAGWIAHLEYDLWRWLQGGPPVLGTLTLRHDHLQTRTSLSDRCGRWIVFDDAREETFVPLEEWKRRYDTWGVERR